MGNPFYIPQQQEPKRDTLATILAALKLGIDAYGTWQQGDIAEKKLEATASERTAERAWEQQKHDETMALGREKLAATQDANRMKAAENPHLMNYGRLSDAQARAVLEKIGVPKEDELMAFSQQMAANDAVNNEVALNQWLQKYQEHRDRLMTIATNKYMANADKTTKDGQPWENTQEAKGLKGMIEAMEADKTGELLIGQGVFKQTSDAISRRDAKAKKEASFAPVNVEGVGLVDPNNREVLVQSKPKPTEASLYRDAAAGDPTAQAALQAMQSGKIKVARESRPPSEAGKPKRVPYRDTQTGAINYYDVNNPQDRATLQKFGTQLAPILENPEDVLIRQALSKKAPQAQPAAATYKTPEEVKAAMERKEITPEAATDILKKKFGFQ